MIFECLSRLEQVYVMRLMCVQTGVPKGDVAKWCKNEKSGKHETTVRALRKMCVLEEKSLKNLGAAYALNKVFQKNMQRAMCMNESPWVEVDANEATMKPYDLNLHADEKWESVLNAMVPPSRRDHRHRGNEVERANKRRKTFSPKHTSSDVANRLLLETGLMDTNRRNGESEITSLGYEFMLIGKHMQAWRFVRAMLRKTMDSEGHAAHVRLLKFIFRLRFCVLGRAYKPTKLTKEFQVVLEEFDSLGLLRFDRKRTFFYPTQLSIDLVSRKTANESSNATPSSSPPSSSVSSSLSSPIKSEPILEIIVETNFHIYAYTKSDLHIRMLGLFVDFQTRLPNMVHGMITRDSVSNALEKGIRASQMRSFLELYAHGLARKETTIVPTNIVDQLYLWEHEQYRVNFEKGCLWEKFDSPNLYRAVVERAMNAGVLLWSNGKKCVISADANAEMKEWFLKARKRN